MAGATLFAFETDPPIEGMVSALEMAANRVSDMSELIEGFGVIFLQLMTEQFASEGSLAGGWADLKDSYDKWKQEHYPGRPIGVLSGALRSAMTGGAGYTKHVSKDSGDFGLGGGPAMEYGKYFSGGGRGPARPVVKWSEAESRRFQQYAHAWLHEQLSCVVHGKMTPSDWRFSRSTL